jgi:hypothetical protein
MRTALIQLAHRCRRLSLYLAAPALLLLNQGQARAVLIYNIYESAGDVVVMASGSLDLTGATKKVGFWSCQPGVIDSPPAILCAGPTTLSTPYQISSPGTFNQTVIRYPASSVSGIATMLYGFFSLFAIPITYTSNTPIVSSATFNSTTLAGLGFTGNGPIGTWTLDGTSETIQVILGSPPQAGAAVPGPMPLLGAAAAFGWSRRLRKRIATPLITPPKT